jgi:hypothetical protein
LFGNGEVPSLEELVVFYKSSSPFILSDIYYELEYGHPETLVVVENGDLLAKGYGTISTSNTGMPHLSIDEIEVDGEMEYRHFFNVYYYYSVP